MRLIWTCVSIAILVIAISASGQSSNNLITMPNIIGMTQDEANETLTDLGLVPLFRYQHNDEVGKNEVISQDLQGKNISRGNKVSIFISLGPYPVNIGNPKENDLVKSMVILNGNVTPSLLEEDKLWIAVRPEKSFNNYWPQTGGPLTWDNKDKTFNGVAFLGGTKGDRFQIVVLVVNKTLSDAFSKWVSVCSAKNNWPPITDKGTDYEMVSKGEIDQHIVDSVWVILNE